MEYAIEIKEQFTFARGQGQRNCGTYHGERWKERYLSNCLSDLKDMFEKLNQKFAWRIVERGTPDVLLTSKKGDRK